MAYETSKCHNLRLARGDFERYLVGNVLDIGCGPDPLRPPRGVVRPWDLVDGDATHLAAIPDNSFDCVYSSHCLEHLADTVTALKNWVRVVKPGRHLYITVPDFLIYEKGQWPSRFNSDHKHTFSLNKTKGEVGRLNHYHILQDLLPLMADFGCELVRVDFEDNGYDYARQEVDQTLEGLWDNRQERNTKLDGSQRIDITNFSLAQICIIWRKK